MQAIFKDAAMRMVATLSDVALFEVPRWLKSSCAGVRCEIYADEGEPRGRIVMLYVRADELAQWRPV
jgi:hypothetical protein